MTHTYSIRGMHCGSCTSRVQTALQALPGVESVLVTLTPPEAIVNATTHIANDAISRALQAAGNYDVLENTPIPHATIGFERLQAVPKILPKTNAPQAAPNLAFAENSEKRTWFATYKPLLTVGAYILLGTLISQINSGGLDWMLAMNTFMGGFFLAFSFFKMLDVPAFADSYSMYDIVAKRWKFWGYAYPFVELALGVAYFTHFAPAWINAVTLVVMSVSIIGVIQSRMSKQQIRCACLGAVFNLPMSSVTIIEDGIMIAMSAFMLLFGH
jgi:copper chaperone CopZ